MTLIQAETRRGVATLTLDSPHNRNALSAALMTELLAALTHATNDDTVRVIVLSHTGPVFCSGADLRETSEAGASESVKAEGPATPRAGTARGELPVARLGDVLATIAECPKPVVARVGGPARAGGIGLIAAADIAVAVDTATFAFSEVRLGVIPAVISATVLPRLAPRAAAELFLTGATFDGRRAAEIGLVTRAVPAEELDAAVDGYCADLVRGAPGALAGTKELLRGRTAVTLRDELTDLTARSLTYFQSPEGQEGVAAFWAKRDPGWVPGA